MDIIIVYLIVSFIYEVISYSIHLAKFKRNSPSSYQAMKENLKSLIDPYFPFSHIIIVGVFFFICPFIIPMDIYFWIKKKYFKKSRRRRKSKIESVSALENVEEVVKETLSEYDSCAVVSLDDRVDRLYGELHPCNIKHVALYAKLHYERSNDVWADIEKCLRADTYTPPSREDILRIVIRNTARLFYKSYNNDVGCYTNEFVEAINEHNCWRYGFYHKECTWRTDHEKLPEYDYKTAVLYFFLSRLQGATILELGGLPEANPNVLPLTTPNQCPS